MLTSIPHWLSISEAAVSHTAASGSNERNAEQRHCKYLEGAPGGTSPHSVLHACHKHPDGREERGVERGYADGPGCAQEAQPQSVDQQVVDSHMQRGDPDWDKHLRGGHALRYQDPVQGPGGNTRSSPHPCWECSSPSTILPHAEQPASAQQGLCLRGSQVMCYYTLFESMPSAQKGAAGIRQPWLWHRDLQQSY